MAKMILAGRDGRSEHPLNSFWRGETDAAHTLAAMRGLPVSKPAPLPREGAAERLLDARRSRASRRQFRCEIPADAAEPKSCEFCDGTGTVRVAACAHGYGRDRSKCSDACLRSETCASCFGTGVKARS